MILWIAKLNFPLHLCIILLIILVPLFIVWSVMNSVAWAYGSTQALPWTTILFLVSFWIVSKFSRGCQLFQLLGWGRHHFQSKSRTH